MRGELRYIERDEPVDNNTYKIVLVLQELVPVENYNGHIPLAPTHEWVDVPTVKEQEQI